MTLNPEKLKKKISFYKLAKALKISLSTAYSWKTIIPAWRVDAIAGYCAEQNIDISDCYEGEKDNGNM